MSLRLPPSIVVATVSCILAMGALTAIVFAQGPGAGPPPATLVEVKAAEVRNLPGSFTFVGTVMPARRAVLGSAVDGRLEEIVEDGVWVEKGAPIARLRTRTINIEIAGAEAEQKLRKHELEELEEGTREEEKRMAEAKRQSSKALADYTRSRYNRTKSLFDRGQATSQEDVEQALSAHVAAEKTHAAAEAEYDLAMNGPRKEKIEQAKDRLLMQNEVVNQLHDRRDKYLIRPYFNGYVVTKHAEVGAWIKQGDPLVEVIELTPVEITVNVPEKHISQIYPNMPAQVRIDGVSMREAWTGTVVRILPQADLRSRTFGVKVKLDNQEQTAEGKAALAAPSIEPAASVEAASPAVEDKEAIQPGQLKLHKFKSGMLAHVSLRLGEKQEALLIPKDALVLGGSSIDGQPSYKVFVAKGNESAEGARTYNAVPVQVALGTFEGDWAEVASRVPGELTKGSLVVTVGNERLQPGQPIRFKAK